MGRKMEDLDIWRSAQVLIPYYGDGAEMAAAARADKAIEQGNPEGESLWKSVLKAVLELQCQKPNAGEPIN
jgi:hypothetical protein